MGHLFTEPIDLCSDFSVLGLVRKIAHGCGYGGRVLLEKWVSDLYVLSLYINTHANIKIKMISVSFFFLI